jgi:hypothetical protein
MDNYEHLAMDELYDILLYNPDINIVIKRNLVDNLMEHYIILEDYNKCGKLEELKRVMRENDEPNNKKT